jgi:hypothetical protein
MYTNEVVRGRATGPVRRVRRRSSACTTGSVPDPATGVPLHGEGRLDVDLHIVVSVLPWVREYQPQPMRLPIWVEGSWSSYIPDGRLLGLVRPLCIEVKPLAKLRASPDLDGRRGAIERALAERGEDFVIWTEREIRAEPLFPNAKLIWSHAKNVTSRETVPACASLRGVAFASMQEVVDVLGGGPNGWRMALALVGMRVLALDLGRPISAASAVRVGSRGWI